MPDELATEPRFEVFSKPGCHLCEQLLEELWPLIRGRYDLVVHDIDTRADWQAAYGSRVPVLRYGDAEICQYTLDRPAVMRIVRGD
jgi:hypothetical protein